MFGLDEVGKVALARAVFKTTALLGSMAAAVVVGNYIVNNYNVETIIPIAGGVACVGLIVWLVKWRYEMERWDIEDKNRKILQEIAK